MFTGAATEPDAGHCLLGCAAGSPATNDGVVRSLYVLSSNDTTKFSDWAYRVTEGSVGATAEGRWIRRARCLWFVHGLM